MDTSSQLKFGYKISTRRGRALAQSKEYLLFASWFRERELNEARFYRPEFWAQTRSSPESRSSSGWAGGSGGYGWGTGEDPPQGSPLRVS